MTDAPPIPDRARGASTSLQTVGPCHRQMDRLKASCVMVPVITADEGSNDVTERERIWHRFAGDEWAAFDALPPALRRRMREHAYDAWAVNALRLWRAERRRLGSARAERRLLRWLDECETLERAAFAEAFHHKYGTVLPHDAAQATVLRNAGTGRGVDALVGAGCRRSKAS